MNEKEFNSWSDEIAFEVSKRNKKEFVCQGMWTPSGFFHIGNARTEIFTPFAVKRSLVDQGFKARQNFIFDDFDVIRKIPAGFNIKESDSNLYLGFPISLAPSPFNGFNNWGEAFVSELKEVIKDYGIKLNFISAYETYKSGKFNELIKFSLDHSKEIVNVWNKVSGSSKSQEFIPVQVVCPDCNKFSFNVKNWDGKEVFFECSCGSSGKISPFNGNAKLHWRVHWVVHWIYYKVDFESAGKDHFSPGSSVDVGHKLIKTVFFPYKQAPPVGLPTEFIQINGKKMAGSLGNVITLKTWLDVASPELFRFMNFSYRPGKVIEFSLANNSFILLNDRFEKAEKMFYDLEEAQTKKLTNQLKRIYFLSKINKPKDKLNYQLPFSFSILFSQLFDESNINEVIDLLKKSGNVFNEITEDEKQEIIIKLKRTRNWVNNFALDFKIKFLEKIPSDFVILNEVKELIPELINSIKVNETSAEILNSIFNKIKEKGIKSKDFFSQIYFILIGKKKGPKLGTLILALGKEKVINRLKELQ